jgi:molybdenum cofactor biosynthesis enzyme MoaA
MARIQKTTSAPARLHEGIPIVPDGSQRFPVLQALPGEQRGCNNGCEICLTQPVSNDPAKGADAAPGTHVVIRDREPTLRKDLAHVVADLSRKQGKTVSLLTNGRMLVYDSICNDLKRAGLARCIVKLFGLNAETHDAHTRVGKSFKQSVLGIATAREAGLEVLVTFPLKSYSADDADDVDKKRRALSFELTGLDPVEMPEPEVEAHAGEYRYDALLLSDAGRKNPLFSNYIFPMVHVNTGPVCNIRCTYCNVRGGDDQRRFAVEDIKRTVDAAVRQVLLPNDESGRPSLDYIGGEPTLHPDLPELVSYGRDQGFPGVSVCTNGVMFRQRKGYLDSLINAGMTMVRYSFHDHRTEYANRFAAVKGLGEHYRETAEMLLSRRDVHIHVYRILLSENMDALPDYIRWLDQRNNTGKPLDLVLGLPSLRGRMFDHPHLYPRLDSLRPHVVKAFKVAEELGVKLIIHHAPACLYPDRPEIHACVNLETPQINELTGEQEIKSFEGDAVYGKACKDCPGRTNGCHGLPSTYWDIDAEQAENWLTPIVL